MVRSRFEHLVRLFSVLSLGSGCGDAVEDGIDLGVLDESLCDADGFAVLEGLRPVEPVDSMQLRDALLDDEGEGGHDVLDMFGPLCGTASDADRCLAELDALPKESEFNTWDTADTRRHRSLLFTRGDEVGRVAANTELHAFLGEIDAPHDAVLVTMMEFHTLVCDGKHNAAETEDGWLLLTETIGDFCELSVSHHIVSVSRGGEMEIVDSEVVEDDLSCVGRIPVGLQRRARPRARRGQDVGRWLAAAAELEAASVTAFDQLAVELMAHDAPRSLVRAARRARTDEIRHARAMGRLAHRWGAAPLPPRIRPWTRRTLVDVAADNLAEGCIRETYGALLATVQARRAADPAVRQVLRRIAVDETRHAALSWALADWARTRLAPGERRRVRAHGRAALERLERELIGSHADAVHRIAGLPRADEARRLFAALRPHMLRAQGRA